MDWRLIGLVALALLCKSAETNNVETRDAFSLYLRDGGMLGGYDETLEPAYAGYSFDVTIDNKSASMIVGQPLSGDANENVSSGAIFTCGFAYTGVPPSNALPTTMPTVTDSANTTSENTHSTESTTTEEDTTAGPTAVAITTASITDDFSQPQCRKIDIFDGTNLEHRGFDHKTDSDALGLNIERIRGEDEYAVCTPLRRRTCPNSISYSTGACYIGKPTENHWKFVKWNETVCYDSVVEIVFVVDGSGSITLKNFNIVKSWLISVVRALIDTYGESVRTEVLQFSETDKRTSGVAIQNSDKFIIPYTLNEGLSFEQISERINNMSYLNRTTYTYYALRRVAEVEFPRSSFFDISHKMIVVLTDGEASDYLLLKRNWVKKFGDLARNSFAVGVGQYEEFMDELKIITNGDNSRVLTVDKFDQLGDVVKNLISSIASTAPAEGSSGPSGTGASDDIASPQIGTSIASGQNGTLYLGSVGMYLDAGIVKKYHIPNETLSHVHQYSELQNFLSEKPENSYLGYSIVTGFFDGPGFPDYVAAGAPRHLLLGAVVISDAAEGDSHVTIIAPEEKRQTASYFGGSLLSVDVSGDGKDDLFVGEPLYADERYDEGRVFVYISQRASSTQNWAKSSYTPHELAGDKSVGGRFGTAMANAGDLNLDGYNDVVIGAPLADDGKGVIFIYHGKEGGIENEPTQKIQASDIKETTLKYFGLSLQGDIDMDSNRYPDIFVGAPRSDTVVLLRTRPIAKIFATIEFTTSTIDIFGCIRQQYKHCTGVKVCFVVNGTSVEPSVGMYYTLTLDSEKIEAQKRMTFESGDATLTQNVSLVRDRKLCFTKVVNMKTGVQDYESLVHAKIHFDLLQAHLARPLSSVRDPSLPNNANSSIRFQKECENTCRANLQLKAEINIPPFSIMKDGAEVDFTENGTVLVIHPSTSSRPITVKVNFTNIGESAFETKLNAIYPSEIALSTVTRRSSNSFSPSCVVEDGLPVTYGNGLKLQAYRYNDDVNIMKPNTWCYFEFTIVTDNFKDDATTKEFTLNLAIFTNSSSTIENDTSDNSWEATTAVLYRSDFTLKKISSDSEVPFNRTKKAKNITFVEEIGNKTEIEMDFTITGSGYSNIPSSQITFKWPWLTEEGNPLLYLFNLSCVARGSSEGHETTCACDETKTNPFNLMIGGGNANSSEQVTVNPTNVTINATQLDCTETDPDTNHTCESITCNVGNLGESDEVTFIAKFRLWTASIPFEGEQSQIDLISYFEISSANSTLVINSDGSNVTIKSIEVVTTAKNFTIIEDVIQTKPEEIYPWAILGGVALLVIIIVILWLMGFFKSKYGEKIKEEKDMQDGGSHHRDADDIDASYQHASTPAAEGASSENYEFLPPPPE